MNVGFIGLGHMGSGMATNLIKAGHTVTVYNRTEERTEPLVALGAKAAKNLADACKGDAVFTMLANDDAVKSVVHQAAVAGFAIAAGLLYGRYLGMRRTVNKVIRENVPESV